MRMNTNTRPMNILAQAVLAAGLAANAVVPDNASAQQQPSASTTGITAPEVDHGPQPDPNMPKTSSPVDLDVQWIYTPYTDDPARPLNVSIVRSRSTPATNAVYLGWTSEEGSWIANPAEKGRIYTWKNKVLTPTNYKNLEEIPEATARRFRNLQVPYLVSRFEEKSARRSTKPATLDQGSAPDPNMPYPQSPTWNLDLQWHYETAEPTRAFVRFLGSHASRAAAPVYLGWTPEEGSWFANPDEKGRIYLWKNYVLAPTDYKNLEEIPEATARRIRNLQEPYLVKRFEKSAPAAPAAPPAQAAKAPQRGEGLFGGTGAVSNALAGFQNQAATPTSGGITGTGATVQGGVLTFTLANNAKATYKVARPAVMQNAPQPSGITGTWVATESNGMGILFTVQPDGSVSGHEVPAQMIQMISQGRPR